MKQFKRVLVANRGEIAIRVIRACQELGIRTIAVYSNEDKNALFRHKADEAYEIGHNKSPVEAYLGIDDIIRVAKSKGADAIHPGYGFLAENAEFAKKCEQAGIVFIGPSHKAIHAMGDKILLKKMASEAGVPTIPGSKEPIGSIAGALEAANTCGYPVMIKAALGGGGRGMRIAVDEQALKAEFESAKREALKAFGCGDVFIEKFIKNPKHIEVQVIGDSSGEVLHLFERDCSIQRRHQKIIEFAPAIGISQKTKDALYEASIKIAKYAKYRNAGTVEFLVDENEDFFFIEMNPRIQVEHTITENITGIDIVQTQLLIASGYTFDSERLNLKQSEITTRGFSIQCRVTTEDPANGFMPDTGKLDVYRTASGFGIRLDGGNGFTGAVITPFYDSLLFKLTSSALRFEDAIKKASRALKETQITGVKTNIPFLLNVLNHEVFKNAACTTKFIELHEDLFDIKPKHDVEARVLNYIGQKVIHETKGDKPLFDVPVVPKTESIAYSFGTKQIFDQEGIEGLIAYIKESNSLLVTDTTMRDAQQSLMATRMRSVDMVKIAEATSKLASGLFSAEVWGGATFDVAYRFLNESPWERLREIRKRMPNVLLQMLIRGSNAVGYKNYPDNVIRAFIKTARENGVDLFRIFDSLNWIEGMKVSIDAVREVGGIAEVAICYTGDILDESKTKYTLDYYVKKAIEIEQAGAHILGIKDMAGLLKPYAAHKLIKALKDQISIPIHLHTHDTTGNGVATLLMAAEAGVDIIDTAFSSMSGLTSQPALNAVVAALKNTDRDTGLDLHHLQQISDYWSTVRDVYASYETGLKSPSAEIYEYEIPGGQYSNLKPQVDSFGLGHRFDEVKQMYKSVNELFGDIVKVTPSSKAVGDMAIFMVKNDLTPENIFEEGKGLTYPDSVVSLLKGMMGQPDEPFDEDLKALVLQGEQEIVVRPGSVLEDEDFEALKKKLLALNVEPSDENLLSYALYPKVFKSHIEHIKSNGDLSFLGSDVFFYGLREGETCDVLYEAGKMMTIRLVEIGKSDTSGRRRIQFDVNGNRREIEVVEKRTEKSMDEVRVKDNGIPEEIGASIPGTVAKVSVTEGEKVIAGQTLLVIEAMKMETEVKAPHDGIVKEIRAKVGGTVETSELVMVVSCGG
ncbi:MULTISPECIES: pyruvate carboxylase [unclassified Fusibacter]|uniref:pyruvate carboxylase n=1 Tax=unclassified Fusibacter TaxID=2624464 RepID=UPI001012C909|nr:MULTISPECIES: pyruvate carboxylase [unclassified Fusibacter]MCK8058281.1 pyruvate carboxylase [Fusibacter sp. A2]NPE20864.1 pyruvate carboxylase [Fusibacter sp. A1]RXV63068.1 pyruvate carboxylase [Fusibacter sp. A1]